MVAQQFAKPKHDTSCCKRYVVPFVSRKQHYIDAAFLWTMTGLVLGFFGVKWVWLGFSHRLAFILIAICLIVGLLKGEFAIGKSAKRAIARIQSFPDRSPFFRVFSRGQWILVLAMMGLGMGLRVLQVDKGYRGIVLTAVGIALVWASRYFWKEGCKSSIMGGTLPHSPSANAGPIPPNPSRSSRVNRDSLA